MTQKIYNLNLKNLSSSKNFLIKNIFKVASQYVFNVFILFNTVSYLKLNSKLKIDTKLCTFENLEEMLKTWKNYEKMSGNPVNLQQ